MNIVYTILLIFVIACQVKSQSDSSLLEKRFQVKCRIRKPVLSMTTTKVVSTRATPTSTKKRITRTATHIPKAAPKLKFKQATGQAARQSPRKSGSKITSGQSRTINQPRPTSISKLKTNKKSTQGSTPATPSFSGDAQFSSDCFKKHNALRSSMGVRSLVWDNNLASIAYTWAKQLVKIRGLRHSNYKKGENLYATFGGDKSCSTAIQEWFNEKKFYRKGQKIGSGSFHQYGHFTQLVWKTTTRVGCGYADSGRDRYIVCEYFPPGNVMGMSAY